MANKEEVQSPCVSVCAMDDITGLCLGCYRTSEEIEGWWDFDAEKQKEVVVTAAKRQVDAADFD